MKTRTRALLVAGTATATAVALPQMAGAVQAGPWSNNGCSYYGLATNQATYGATGQVWGDSGCSAGWVEIHYTDSKGNSQVDAVSSAWGSAGGSTAATGGDGTTISYACVSARSRSAGNWSVVRKVGSGAGGCGTP